jgi:hypothetical protein
LTGGHLRAMISRPPIFDEANVMPNLGP